MKILLCFLAFFALSVSNLSGSAPDSDHPFDFTLSYGAAREMPVQLLVFTVSAAQPRLLDIVRDEQRNNQLERLFAPRRLPSLEIRGGLLSPIVENSRFADAFLSDVEDLVIFGTDVAERYRGGYRISPHGMLYLKGGLMYGRAGSNFSYGILSAHHHTGPAFRLKW